MNLVISISILVIFLSLIITLIIHLIGKLNNVKETEASEIQSTNPQIIISNKKINNKNDDILEKYFEDIKI